MIVQEIAKTLVRIEFEGMKQDIANQKIEHMGFFQAFLQTRCNTLVAGYLKKRKVRRKKPHL